MEYLHTLGDLSTAQLSLYCKNGIITQSPHDMHVPLVTCGAADIFVLQNSSQYIALLLLICSMQELRRTEICRMLVV